MDLSNLTPAPGAIKKRKRIGRGPGSGHGKTACRGHKGRGSRAGGNTPPGYEGGQMPLQRRLPKRGFRNPFHCVYSVVNLRQLEARFESGALVDPATLHECGLVRRGFPVKILASGELTKPLSVSAHAFSAAAKERIAAVGGTTEVISRA